MPTYSLRYVAFIDILGFSEIVTKSATSDRQAKALATILTGLANRPPLPPPDNAAAYDFKAQLFSDSIVLSVVNHVDALTYLLKRATELSLELLPLGFLLRGGVARGLLYHEQATMFGPAFLEAYLLEKEIATYPRIIVGREAYEQYRQTSRRPDQDRSIPVVDLDDDGPAYLDIFSRFEAFRGPMTDELSQSAQELHKSIAHLLNLAIHKPRHFQKLKWLAEKWNDRVSDSNGGYPSVIFPSLASRFS